MIAYCILTFEFPPDKGGVGNFAAAIADALQKDTVHILLEKNIRAAYELDPRVIKTRFFSRWVWPHWLPMLFSLRNQYKKNPHIRFLSMAVLPLGTAALLAKKIFGVRYTLMIHGMDLAIHENATWKKWLIKKIITNAESVIAISQYSFQLALQFGAVPAKTSLCHPTAHITPDAVDSQTQVQKKLIHSDYFLSVGRLVKRKNYLTLIRAFKQFIQKNPSVSLVIVGNGPEYKTIQNEICELKLQNNIFLKSKVSDDDLISLYSHAQAICFIPTSENGDVEGFGIAAIEGSAFSKPVIASNQGGVTDAVAENISGILVNPYDINGIALAMERVMRPDVASRLGIMGRKRYEEQFMPKVFAKKMRSLLQPSDAHISVIIPAYNSESTIRACIASLLKQTVKPKEICIVDDGSTDGTQAICKSFESACTYISLPHAGAPTARNVGAKNTTGAYILFIDADCTCEETMLERMQFALENNQHAAYAYSAFYHGWKKFPSFEFNADLLRKMNYIHTSSLLRRSSFPGFDESLKRFQDWDIWLTLLERGEVGIHIPEPLYRLATKKGNISSWLPSFAYSFPFIRNMARVATYKQFEDIIKKKHSV